MHERILLCYLNYFTETCSLKWNYGNSQRFYKKYKEYRFSKKKKKIYSDATLQYLQSFAHASSWSFCDEQEKITMILLMKPSPKIFQIKKKSFIYVKITRIPIENKLHISPYIVHCKQVTLWQSEIRLTRFSPIKSEAV